MTIDELLMTARKTWGTHPMTLPHIAIAAEVVTGDICRQARRHMEGSNINEIELKKELGNLITSAIRWCDDLGYSPQECITLSQNAQSKYTAQ